MWLRRLLVVLIVLALSSLAEAQQPKKVFRLGYLSNTDPATDSARTEGIRLALRELGYIEGQIIASELGGSFSSFETAHQSKPCTV